MYSLIWGKVCGYGYVIPDPPIYVFLRTSVREYVCTLAVYLFKYKVVSTALTPVLCASLNRL